MQRTEAPWSSGPNRANNVPKQRITVDRLNVAQRQFTECKRVASPIRSTLRSFAARRIRGERALLFCVVESTPGTAHVDFPLLRRIALPITIKPTREFPRLCRGGSKSLTYPVVDTAAPSTKLRIVSRQAQWRGSSVIDGHERLSHTKWGQ
jgi:hypothetical protein